MPSLYGCMVVIWACCSKARDEVQLLPSSIRKQTTTKHSYELVIALLQWHMVYKLGEDELHRAPVVALNFMNHALRSKVLALYPWEQLINSKCNNLY